MPKKKVLFLVGLLAAGMLFRGCSGSGGGSADKAQGTEGMADQDGGGQVMKIGTAQGSATPDPANGYDYWYMVRYGVCDTLLGFNENMTPYGWGLWRDRKSVV